MKRHVARWLIGEAVEASKELPGWLERWCDRDPDLRRWEVENRQLMQRLRADAVGWKESCGQVGDGRVANERRVVRCSRGRCPYSPWRIGAAVAACLFVAASILGLTRGLGTYQGHPSVAATPSASRDHERRNPHQELIGSAWLAGQQWVDQVRQQAGSLSVPLTTDPTFSGSAPWEQPFEAAGSSARRLLACFQHGLQSEQRQITADARSLLDFFTHRLPASTTRLLGMN